MTGKRSEVDRHQYCCYTCNCTLLIRQPFPMQTPSPRVENSTTVLSPTVQCAPRDELRIQQLVLDICTRLFFRKSQALHCTNVFFNYIYIYLRVCALISLPLPIIGISLLHKTQNFQSNNHEHQRCESKRCAGDPFQPLSQRQGSNEIDTQE